MTRLLFKRIFPNMTHQQVAASVIIFTAASLFFGCQKKQETPPAPPPPPEVTVAKPTVKNITNYIYFTGYTEAMESVELRARVEGYLESFNFQPGAMVEKGDLLFIIDTKPFQARVEQAEADVRTKQAELKLAQVTLDRKRSAFKEKAVSELTVIEAQAGLSIAQASVKGAEAALVNAQLNLSYSKIYAPVKGRISRNLVDIGNLVGSGGDKTKLATLVNDDPIYVYFNVDERSLVLLKQYYRRNELKDPKESKFLTSIALEGEKDYLHTGYGDYIDNEVDRGSGTIQVRAVFENRDHVILPGMFARVRIPTEEVNDALLVPDSSLSADQRGKYLLTVNSQNKVEYKPVTTGALIDGLRVITEGIKKDDRVITAGIQRTRPGAPVTPQENNLKSQNSPSPLSKKASQ